MGKELEMKNTALGKGGTIQALGSGRNVIYMRPQYCKGRPYVFVSRRIQQKREIVFVLLGSASPPRPASVHPCWSTGALSLPISLLDYCLVVPNFELGFAFSWFMLRCLRVHTDSPDVTECSDLTHLRRSLDGNDRERLITC